MTCGSFLLSEVSRILIGRLRVRLSDFCISTIRFLHFDYTLGAFRVVVWARAVCRYWFSAKLQHSDSIFSNVVTSHLKTNELIKYDTAMIPNTNNTAMIPNTIRMKPRSINFSKLSCTREWKRKLRISFVIPLICINFATNCFCDGQTAICYIKSGEHNTGVHTIWKLR